MTAFDDVFAAAAWPAMAALDGETVVITDPDGTTRPITALVNRNPPQPIAEVLAGGAIAPWIEMDVLNDATRGIASGLYDSGTFFVTVAMRKGATPTRQRVTKLLRDAGGVLTFEVK